jgi:hypothetical protein
MTARFVALSTLVLAAAGACSSFGSSSDSPPTDAGTPTEGAAAADAHGGPASCTAPKETDGDNCGECGHSCFGGSCVGGVCQPFKLASFQADRVIGVAGDATHVGWLYATAGVSTVASVSVGGGTPNLQPLGADATFITAGVDAIWAAGEGGDNAKIYRIGSDGLLTTALTGFSGLHFPVSVLPAPDMLYILDYADGASDGIYTLPYNGGAASAPTKIAPLNTDDTSRWADLLHVQDRVFVFEYGGISTATVPTTGLLSVYCSQAQGCVNGVAAIATDGTSVYWIDDSAGTVARCPAGAQCSGPTPLATATGLGAKPVLLSSDGSRLAIGTALGGDQRARLFWCEPEQCSNAKPAASDTALAGRIFATSSALYWIADDGPVNGTVHSYRVMRLVR